MAAAIDECEKLGIPIVYGDRDQRVSIKRMEAQMSTMGVARIMGRVPAAAKAIHMDVSSFWGRSDEGIADALKNRETTLKIVKFAHYVAPEVAHVLLTERDVILCDAIKNAPVRPLFFLLACSQSIRIGQACCCCGWNGSVLLLACLRVF